MDQDDPIVKWAAKREKAIRRQHRLDTFRRRTGMRAGIVLRVLVAALLVAVAFPFVRKFMGSDGSSPAAAGAYATASTPPGVTVTTSESAAPTRPFIGTPAEHYPLGAAGITLPPAKAVNGFSKSQVQVALTQVRTALIASRLDTAMIVRHDTSGFVKLLAPSSQAAEKKEFGTDYGPSVVTWIDPRVQLDPNEQTRVSGRITYAAHTENNVRSIAITTNFVFVYAFQRSDHAVAAQHAEIVWLYSEADNLRPQDRGLFISKTNGYEALVDCSVVKKGLLAPTPVGGGNASPDPKDTEDPMQLLRADHSLDIHDDC